MCRKSERFHTPLSNHQMNKNNESVMIPLHLCAKPGRVDEAVPNEDSKALLGAHTVAALIMEDVVRSIKADMLSYVYSTQIGTYIDPHACTQAYRNNGVNKLPGYCRPSINKAVCKSQPMRQ